MKTINLVAAVASCVVGCSQRARTITLIFPDEFVGLAKVSEDENLANPKSKNETYTIEISKAGTATIRSLEIFERWHKLRGRFKNGTLISDVPLSGTNVSVFPLPVNTKRESYFFVGTAAEADAVEKSFDFRKLPLGVRIGTNLNNGSH